VTVITRDEINRSGVTTAAELLDKISANSGGGYNVSQAVGDSGTPGLAAASLRGLGSTNTLILLNGRRLSNYAFNASGGGAVNLNQIPLGRRGSRRGAEGRRLRHLLERTRSAA
jgi:iron complex outermembrane receptor protein